MGLLTASAFCSPLAASAADLYVSSLASNTISRIASDGTVSTFVSGLNAPANLQLAGIAFSGGFLYAADFGNNAIQKFAPDGTFTTFISGLNIPAGIAFDPSGNLFEVDFGSNSVNKIAPDGKSGTRFSRGYFDTTARLNIAFDRPEGIAIDGDNVYVSDRTTITQIPLSSGGFGRIFRSSDHPVGLAIVEVNGLPCEKNSNLLVKSRLF